MKKTKLFIIELEEKLGFEVYFQHPEESIQNSILPYHYIDEQYYNSSAEIYLHVMSNILSLYDTNIKTYFEGRVEHYLHIVSPIDFNMLDFVNTINSKKLIIDNTLLELVIDDEELTLRNNG